MTISRFGPVEPSLDHLVYAAPDLDAAVREFTAVTGVAPAQGGRHLGRGTRNVLVGFGETGYLEIIGPDPEQPATPMLFGLDDLDRARLVTWAVHPPGIEDAAAAARLGDVAPMSRRTPDGALLEWRLTAPGVGAVPFLIDWGTTPHPAAALPRVGLRGLRATDPDPGAVAAVLDALGVTLVVEPGPPGLAALLDTPRGPVVLG